jgi:hypothetical protein
MALGATRHPLSVTRAHVHIRGAIGVQGPFFIFSSLFFSPSLKIHTSSSKNLLCPLVSIFINFSSYYFDFDFFFLLIFNFISKHFILFNFFYRI